MTDSAHPDPTSPRNPQNARSATDPQSSRDPQNPTNPRITVLPVQAGDPPFRILQIDGEMVGRATSMTDVLFAARAAGITVHDLDDPAAVRWVGGGKLTWRPH